MADQSGPLGEALRGEEEEAEDALPQTAFDPIAAALAVGGSNDDPSLRDRLTSYLAGQERLVAIQTEHLHEQRNLQLSHLYMRRWKDRLSLATQALGVILAGSVFIALAILIWEAHADRGLVIQGFTAPPGFAARGISGDGVASDVLGDLSGIIRYVRERSFSRTDGVSTDTSNEVKIEIPETGISLTEAWRVLREMLGSARKVTGSLREETNGQITLTARLDGGEVFSATGPVSDLPALEQKVAEQLYGATDLNNLPEYYSFKNRKADAFAAAGEYAAHAVGRNDRANAITVLGDVSDDPARLRRYGLIALTVDPELMAAHFDLASAAMMLEKPQEALSQARAMLSAHPVDQPPQHQGNGATHMLGFARTNISELQGDYSGAIRERGPYLNQAPRRSEMLLEDAADYARLHDRATALNLIAEAEAYGEPDPWLQGAARYEAALSQGDWPGARTEAQSLVTQDAQATAQSKDADATAGLTVRMDRNDRPMLALAEAHTGDLAAAKALVDAMPADCYACLLVHANLASMSGQAAAAERWFSEAIRQNPDVPQAYADRGRSRLERHDLSGALADATRAAALEPRFADAQKLWGDTLAARGLWSDAAKRYDAALLLAPTWVELQKARAIARARSRS